MSWNYNLKMVIFSSAVLLGCGCSKIRLKPPPTAPLALINVEITASEYINPTISGRPSPVVVRLYELKNLTTFNAADFFTLYRNDLETLTGDLVKREEYVLHPGGKKIYRHKASEEARYLAVIAAFRDIDQAAWKGSLPIPASRTTNITVQVNKLGLTLEVQ